MPKQLDLTCIFVNTLTLLCKHVISCKSVPAQCKRPLSIGAYNKSFQIEILNPFLNQARTGHRLACAWFLEIVLSTNVGVCVCASAPKAINNKSCERHA